jgi:hypothetical protein
MLKASLSTAGAKQLLAIKYKAEKLISSRFRKRRKGFKKAIYAFNISKLLLSDPELLKRS